MVVNGDWESRLGGVRVRLQADAVRSRGYAVMHGMTPATPHTELGPPVREPQGIRKASVDFLTLHYVIPNSLLSATVAFAPSSIVFDCTQSFHKTTMVRTTALLAATAAFALDARAESMYTKKSGVLSINGMDYDRVIAKSNYTSVRAPE